MASSEENALRPKTLATSPETPDWHQGVLVKGTPETPVHLIGDSGLEQLKAQAHARQLFLDELTTVKIVP